MQLGVSTSCLFPLETELALARLGDLGVRTAEVYLNCPSEASPDFIRELARIARMNGMRITALHPYCSDTEGILFFGSYPRRLRDGLAEYRRIFEGCAALGAKLLVFHGAKNFQSFPRELYWERYCLLQEEAQRFGVTVCQENVARCMSHDIGFLRAMAISVPQARFVLDTKQALRSGIASSELIDAMGAQLARVHLSDYRPGCDCVAPGEGEMDYAAFFERLRAIGFDGDVIIELYRSSYEEEDALARSLRYLHRFCPEAAV